MTNFLKLSTIETVTAHTYDYNITVYFRTGKGEKQSATFHRYHANELAWTVEDTVKTVTEFAWADEATYATCVKVYCWKTGETFWFSVR